MATKKPVDAFAPVTVGTDDLEPDDVVGVLRTALGAAVIVPRSVGRLQGEQAEALADVQHVAAAIGQLQAKLDEAVREARDLGVSWGAIGWSVGKTAQGAQQRWGDDPSE